MKIRIIPFDSPEAGPDLVSVYEVKQVPARGDLIKWQHTLDEHCEDGDTTLTMTGTVHSVYWDFTVDEIDVHATDIKLEGPDV